MSSNRNTLVRSMHDIGAAAWFGGSLMGAVALNGATNDISEHTDRARIASEGWARWSPVNAAAIGAHLIGGLGLVLAHRGRVRNQAGVSANTAVKTGITALALASTAYSGVLGAKVAAAGAVPADGATKPARSTPAGVANAQQQLRVLQWLTPVLTAALVILGAQQGEQQRPGERLRGIGKKLYRRGADALPS